MSVEVLTILMFMTLMASIALGHPLAVTLAAVATVFGLIDNGFDVSALLGLFANNAWGIFLNYVLVAIPLFIFMAQILDRSKVSEGLFDALYQVLGGLRGGLGMAVIVVSTVFAATTGIIGASVVAMGLMAGPALLRRGYNRGLGAGIICASGTLGILIPPSIMLVVYGGLTGQKETSVGNLFAAAIMPGLLLSALYLLYVGVRCYINPKMGPPIPREDRTATVGEKIAMTLKNFVPPFGLILTVMGTILAGIATPTEAAALGCIGALILAMATKKLKHEAELLKLALHAGMLYAEKTGAARFEPTDSAGDKIEFVDQAPELLPGRELEQRIHAHDEDRNHRVGGVSQTSERVDRVADLFAVDQPSVVSGPQRYALIPVDVSRKIADHRVEFDSSGVVQYTRMLSGFPDGPTIPMSVDDHLRLQKEREITVVLVEHDLGVVMDISDRIYVLDFGQLIGAGRPEEVAANPKVIEAYIGEE